MSFKKNGVRKDAGAKDASSSASPALGKEPADNMDDGTNSTDKANLRNFLVTPPSFHFLDHAYFLFYFTEDPLICNQFRLGFNGCGDNVLDWRWRG